MSSEIALRVNHVSKVFRAYSNPAKRLTHALGIRANNLLRTFGLPQLAGDQAAVQEFTALDDISFEVMRGHTTGIVGRNGAGKSTLLQIIAGTLAPSQGTVDVSGRIAALLELGSGFNPEFNGIENARLNAAILGLSPEEIDARMDSILAFADIGHFVNRPKFQSKCFARLEALKETGTSILFVSHSTEQIVSHCDDAILIEGGRLRQRGQPKDVVHTYLDLLFGKPPASTPATGQAPRPTTPAHTGGTPAPETRGNRYVDQPHYNPYEFRWGDGAACIADFRLLANGTEAAQIIPAGTSLQLLLGISFERAISRPIMGLTIKSKDGVTVFGTNSELSRFAGLPGSVAEGAEMQVDIRFECNLGPGDYFISVGLASRSGEEIIPHDRRYDSIHFTVTDDECFGFTKLPMTFSIKELRS